MARKCLSVCAYHACICKLFENADSFTVANPLSISHVSSSTNGVDCTFHGIDNSVTTVNGAGSVDVGPPQTQVSGSCHKLWRRDNSVSITFIGAADAKFEQAFPIDGSAVQICKSAHLHQDADGICFEGKRLTSTANPLSISHIEIDTAGVSCIFNGVDNSVTSVTGPATVDVGPPQTQVKGTCWATH